MTDPTPTPAPTVHAGYASPAYPVPVPAPLDNLSPLDDLPEALRELLLASYERFTKWLRDPSTLRLLSFCHAEHTGALRRASNIHTTSEERTLQAGAATIFLRLAEGELFRRFYEADQDAIIGAFAAEAAAERTAREILRGKDDSPDAADKPRKGYGV